ncbi:uncharacterized protein LOC117119509 [Anneissia japonica]|uniref:uncharacterized protein LOC117119509 n=1 Tax=Anneissia japonica TaxID=1529436 RepID=UPI0014257C15|nr:uncharacterized protein LOC117119509 [Anneissia japonica]
MDDSGCEMSGDLDSQLFFNEKDGKIDSAAKFDNSVSISRSSSSMSQTPLEYFDIVIVCSLSAVEARKDFMNFAEKQQWKVFLPRREKLVGEDEFKTFKRGYDVSTYIVLLLTPCFEEDVWAVNRFQTALKLAIQEKRSNVIPVLYGLHPTKVPFELTAIANIKREDEFFDHVMKRTIDTNLRKQRQMEYDDESSNLEAVSQDIEVDSMDLAGASYADIFSTMSAEHSPLPNSARFLNPRLFHKLCMALDIPSPNMNGDWRGLATSLNLKSEQITYIESNSRKPGFSATKKVLDVYFQKNKNLDEHSVLSQLQQVFKGMDFGKGIQIMQEALESC